jgi:hypothetical protein
MPVLCDVDKWRGDKGSKKQLIQNFFNSMKADDEKVRYSVSDAISGHSLGFKKNTL